MASDKQHAEVRDMIESFHGFAGTTLHWDGDINDKVAEVFGIML